MNAKLQEVLNKYKKGKPITGYESVFQKFIVKKYSQDTFKKIKPALDEFFSFRNKIVQLNAPTTSEEIQKNIDNYLVYDSCLDKIKEKFRFGSSDNEINIQFGWTEITTGKQVSVSNIDYERCSIKYNLAVSLCLKGDLYKDSQDANDLKLAMNIYSNAASVFEEIFAIATENVNKLLPSCFDFTSNYMEYCKNYALGMAYSQIYNIALRKKAGSLLLSKLAMGTSAFFCLAINETIPTIDKVYVTYLSNYYNLEGLMLYLGTFPANEDIVNAGIGNILGYYKLAIKLEALCEGAKYKYPKSINLIRLKLLYQTAYEKFSVLQQLNNTYLQPITTEENLDPIEIDQSKLKVGQFKEHKDALQCLNIINSF